MADSARDPVGDAIAEAAPAAFAEKAEAATGPMLALSVLAGLFIGLGSVAFLVVQGTAAPVEGGGLLLSGLAFSVGLVLVMLTGAELFTGNTMFPLAAAAGRLGWPRVARAWAVVWVGNLFGALLLAALFVAADGHDTAEGEVGRAALRVAKDKLDKGAGAVLASGVLANLLVCLAVWCSMAARTVPAKVLAIAGPVGVFVAAGFEHSVANMSLLPIAVLVAGATGQAAPEAGGIAANLALSTLGNIAGGALLALSLGWAHGVLRSAPAAGGPQAGPRGD